MPDPCEPPAATRPGETVVPLPARHDAGLFFIGRIRTPWLTPSQCPKRGDLDGPECRIEVDLQWVEALDGIEQHGVLQVLYWMHLSRRDLTRQRPRSRDTLLGTFSIRSPMRPNPIASSPVRLLGRSSNILTIRGLDCVDGTPLVDLKPELCPILSPQRRNDPQS